MTEEQGSRSLEPIQIQLHVDPPRPYWVPFLWIIDHVKRPSTRTRSVFWVDIFYLVGAWQEWQKYQKYCPTIIYALGFITLTLPLQKLSALIIHHWMIRKEIMWGRNPFNEHWNTKISKQKNGSHILIRVRHMLTFHISRRLSFESLKKKDWPGFVA
jgi:hypothetical protein